ncbi:caveolin-3-like [Mytilus trossulus]|uniref:caveolin-3-like n=1 Tax=Mytilus trossulus TaxID=6551 RepID=UPI003003D340
MSAISLESEKNFRDPQDINEFVKVKFDDVIAEPNDVESPDCVWNTSHECFTCSRNCCYTALSGLCGWLLSICWGFNFAIMTFTHVWCGTPCARNISINCNAIQRCFGQMVTCWLAPFCETCSIALSRIVVTQKSN